MNIIRLTFMLSILGKRPSSTSRAMLLKATLAQELRQSWSESGLIYTLRNLKKTGIWQWQASRLSEFTL